MERMRIIGLLVLMTGSIALRSSAQGFDRRYDPLDHGAQTAFGVEQVSADRYLVFFATDWVDSIYSETALSTLLLDPMGNELEHHRVEYPAHSTYPGFANVSFPLSSGGFGVGGSTEYLDGTQRSGLFVFNDHGVPLGFHEYGPLGEEWIGRQGKQTPDGGFVICGETSSFGSIDAFLLKIDSAANQEWVQTYGSINTYEYAVAVDLLPDGGYYLGGEVFGQTKQLKVLRLDSVGGVTWSRIWGSAYDEPNAHLITSSDGNCIVASAWGYAPDFSSTRPYIAKLDQTNGSTIWEHEYGPMAYSTGFFAVKEVQSNDDLICAGYDFSDIYERGLMMRASSNGDSLWMRRYRYYDNVMPDGKGKFMDVLPTIDGGFIAVGATYGSGIGPTPPGYNQDVWVVKVDSMGCIVPGCDIITGIHAQITNLKDALTVYPVPLRREQVDMGLHVRIALPAHFRTEGPLMLTMTSLDGRLVRQQQVPTSATDEVTVEVSALASGTYALHLSDAQRWIAGKTFVVE